MDVLYLFFRLSFRLTALVATLALRLVLVLLGGALRLLSLASTTFGSARPAAPGQGAGREWRRGQSA